MIEIIDELDFYNSPAEINPDSFIRHLPVDWGEIGSSLTDGLLASYLLATYHVSNETKRGVAEFADPIQAGFNVAPREAIEYFKVKKIVTRKEFDNLAEDARASAFTVAGVYRDDILKGFKDEITSALETGASQQQVIKRFRSILDGEGHRQLGAFHLETVFRSNMSLAYNTGRRRALEEVAEDLPYWQYSAVLDDRTRPNHAALNQIIFPANHSFWNEHFPPIDFNCRCTVIALEEIPDDYSHTNPSGDVLLAYDESGIPAKAEINGIVYSLIFNKIFRGIPPKPELKEVIEGRGRR